jgi:NTE family protein
VHHKSLSKGFSLSRRRTLLGSLSVSAYLAMGRPARAAGAAQTLVLAGGGATGTAWLTGLLLGLQRGGVDPNAADLAIGTSAGSIVGAQLRSGMTLPNLFEAQKTVSPSGLAAWARNVDARYLAATSALFAKQPTTPAMRAQIGARALAAALPGEAEWLATFFPTSGLAGLTAWPQRKLDVVTVDAVDGSIKVFDGHEPVSLNLAVAASAAVPSFTPPITIGGRRYIDGGVAGTNITLAAGSKVVLAIIPHADSIVPADLEQLRSAGSQVVVLTPDAGALDAIGPNTLDASRKPGAADAGLRQGGNAAAALRGIWRS